MPQPLTNLEKIKHYLKAIEDGNFGPIAELFAPSAVMEQLPNRIYPNGGRCGISGMAEAFERGRKLFSRQTCEIKRDVTDGNHVALEVLWIGKLGVALGSLAAGSEMRAHSAMFFEFKDGKIKISASATTTALSRGRKPRRRAAIDDFCSFLCPNCSLTLHAGA